MKEEVKHIIDTEAYTIQVDIEKNRVYFCIRGRWDKETKLEDYLDKWKEAISYLEPNFTIIADVRTMLPHAISVEKVHEEAQRYLIENGLFKVAEVISLNDIAALQATRVAERSNFPISKFSSFEGAEKYLDQVVGVLK
ncbi:hypothetical protein [Bernardetia sp.]|uniref:hypothetical protein n=1 Tax=Bernardetia sp. TaxID=1937974 RepID=UPI0025C45F2A|nr:hypothetical protein [Bernardetia sp.]